LVAFGFAHFNQIFCVFEIGLKAIDRAERVFELGAFAHQLLGFFRIVPEIGAFNERVEFGKTSRGGVDVKDASSAVQLTAWRLRPDFEFLRAYYVVRFG
jgi:hypothetical protein